jgi:hypothetical protein
MAANSTVGVDRWNREGAGGADVVGGPRRNVREHVFNWITTTISFFLVLNKLGWIQQ